MRVRCASSPDCATTSLLLQLPLAADLHQKHIPGEAGDMQFQKTPSSSLLWTGTLIGLNYGQIRLVGHTIMIEIIGAGATPFCG